MSQFARRWLSDYSTYPIFVICGGGGFGLLGYFAGRRLLSYPEMNLAPESRVASWEDKHNAEAMRFTTHSDKFRDNIIAVNKYMPNSSPFKDLSERKGM